MKAKKKVYVNEKLCVGCGTCMQICPRGAIAIKQGIYAVIEANKCVSCGK